MVPGQVGLGSEQTLPPGPGREPGQGSRCALRTGKGLASKSQAEGLVGPCWHGSAGPRPQLVDVHPPCPLSLPCAVPAAQRPRLLLGLGCPLVLRPLCGPV